MISPKMTNKAGITHPKQMDIYHLTENSKQPSEQV